MGANPKNTNIKSVRGTRDLLPPETDLWFHVEHTARRVFARYGFSEIRTPVFEDTQLFARSVGEETDIVQKEMYTWEDRARAQSEKAQSLTLRPENTAGVVRAYIEHGLGEGGLLQKLFYIGPQFRCERPQKGRYRQFYQIGAEVIGAPTSGSESPLRDAEVLEMLATLLNELGIKDWTLHLNSVGSSSDRPRYIAALKAALEPVKAKLCADCQRRAETNPLRVLDCKVPEDQATIATLPVIADYLDDDSKAHFAAVLAALDACGVKYVLNPRLVRGLDYYTRTAFEFTIESGLGTQNALLGGGRYDGLSEMLGGPKAPGIGFAIGEDRLILTLQAMQSEQKIQKLDAFIAPIGEAQNAFALALAKELRAMGLKIELGDGSFRLKKSFETADKIARKIVLVGEDEAKCGVLTVKDFASGEQAKIARAELATALK
jgi:histidyl-tRNA synthetase